MILHRASRPDDKIETRRSIAPGVRAASATDLRSNSCKFDDNRGRPANFPVGRRGELRPGRARGDETMTDRRQRRPIWASGLLLMVASASTWLGAPTPARAGKMGWLDDLVQQVVREAKAGGRVAARGVDDVPLRPAGRLFANEAEEGLEAVAKRADSIARLGRGAEAPSEALLQTRFARLIRAEPEAARAFGALAPAEKRLVVEMGETAQRIARRYPAQAETMIRKLGPEGMAAVRVYGDDVAQVVAREGTESLGVLRKTGRGGWAFFTGQVLPHKKKLAAAGVLALFLANPDKFVDSAGRVTEYAVREFSKAGIRLAGAIGGGATRGLEAAVGDALAARGIDSLLARRIGMGLAGAVAVLAAMVLIGLPIGWMFRPFAKVARLIRPRRPAVPTS